MHTEASDFLGGLRPVRRTSEEVCAAVLFKYMILEKKFMCIFASYLNLRPIRAFLHMIRLHTKCDTFKDD